MEVRCEPATRPCKPQPLRLVGQRLDVARQRVVGLVAVDVDQQAALRCDLAERFEAARPVLHRALEMRDAADHVDALVERALEILRSIRRAVVAVLREGDELQVDIGSDLLLHLEQRVDGRQPVVADVDMRADREQPLGDGEVAIAERALGTASTVRSGFSSPQSAMPSSSVPETFMRGRPSDSVASMWKCTSMNGGETRRPVASMTRPASAEIFGSIATILPPAQAMSTFARAVGERWRF